MEFGTPINVPDWIKYNVIISYGIQLVLFPSVSHLLSNVSSNLKKKVK